VTGKKARFLKRVEEEHSTNARARSEKIMEEWSTQEEIGKGSPRLSQEEKSATRKTAISKSQNADREARRCQRDRES